MTSCSSFAWRAMPAFIAWLTFLPPRRRENSICFGHHSYHTTFNNKYTITQFPQNTQKFMIAKTQLEKTKIDTVEVISVTDKPRLFLKRRRKESERVWFLLRGGKSSISLPLDKLLLDTTVMDKALLWRGDFEGDEEQEEEERIAEQVRVEAKANAASMKAISSSLIISMGIWRWFWSSEEDDVSAMLVSWPFKTPRFGVPIASLLVQLSHKIQAFT